MGLIKLMDGKIKVDKDPEWAPSTVKICQFCGTPNIIKDDFVVRP